jgi:glycosyltransferase involved in cell wall biosynthesis
MRILVLSPYLAHSEIGHGGGISTYHLARHLARRHELTLLCFARADDQGRERELEEAGVRVWTVPFLSPADRGLRRLAFFADRLFVRLRACRGGRPSFAEKYGRSAMRSHLLHLLENEEFEIVQAEYEAMGSYLEIAREWRDRRQSPGPRLLLNTHEAGILPRRRRLAAATGAERIRLQRALVSWEGMVTRAIAAADRVQCVTPQDRQLLVELVGDPDAEKLRVLPFGVDGESLPAARVAEGPARLLFVGSYGHAPNVEAARLLIESIVPQLRSEFPQLQCDLVGRGLPADLRSAAGEGIRILGFVEDLDRCFDGAWIFAAPLFSGGGIKIKILEAMARGSAVLSTPMGLEGIDTEIGVHAFCAEDVGDFITQTRQLLVEPQRLRALGRAARSHTLSHYDWEVIVDRWEREMASD